MLLTASSVTFLYQRSLEDIQSKCILLVRKKSYSIENNTPMKKKSYRTGRRSESLQGLGGVMIYYFQKLVGVVTFLTKIQKLEGNSTTLKNWIQKLEGKPTTLKNWIQKMEGNSTTPKNCVLTNFLNERSTIFFLVFSLIWFWIFVRNDTLPQK